MGSTQSKEPDKDSLCTDCVENDFKEGEYAKFRAERDSRNTKEEQLRKVRGTAKASDVLLRQLDSVRSTGSSVGATKGQSIPALFFPIS